jgi:hypothetical protein
LFQPLIVDKRDTTARQRRTDTYQA